VGTENVRLTIVSHKEVWCTGASRLGYVTVGGFPFQIRALAELFDETIVICLLYPPPAPTQAQTIGGHRLSVRPFPAPAGKDLRRKLALLSWLPRYLPSLWREITEADAVHTPLPSDIGTIGLFIALIQCKPVFVRYCGTWGDTSTRTQRFLSWLLPRIAGGRNVVLATGGGTKPPCPDNPSIRWIFATTITQEEWERLPVAKPWDGKGSLHLITVSRLDPAKNTSAIIKALPEIRQKHGETYLHIVGDGPAMPYLRTLARNLRLDHVVIFHGNLSHEGVLQALSQAHLFVFPTRVKEGFPKAVLEAMACGLPVIATNVSVIPYLIGEDRGIILQDTSSQAVARAVIELLSAPDRMAQMGQEARAMSRCYTLEAWRDTIGSILKEAWGPLRGSEHA